MKKYLSVFSLIVVIIICISCNGGNVKFKEENGHKKYKKENGDMAQAEWATINGNDYYFDMNGYLQTNTWIDNDYYVDESGKKLIKSWYEDKENNKTYYLSSNGKYLKDTLATIDNKDYYFNSDGSLVKDEIFKNKDDKFMAADENGVINNSNGLVTIKDNTYYIDKFGIIFTSGWKEVDKDWYYFKDDGTMKKNEWYEATYYFGDDGKMMKNGKSPEGYEVDGEGKVLEQYKSVLLAKDFKYIYKEYCKYPWAEVGSDGSYISIDTNPDDYDSSDHPYLSSLYIKEAFGAIEKILKVLGFPDYVSKEIKNTSFKDGKQTEVLGDVTVNWTYHPDKGVEIMFVKKK